MHNRLFDKLCLDSAGAAGGTSEVSRTVDLAGGNAGQIDLVLFVLDGPDNMSCQIQESNDLENWTDKGSVLTFGGQGIGRKLFGAVTGLTAAHVRVTFGITGNGLALMAAGINLSKQ